ncbi:MAG: hypothetical protein ACYC6A_16785 [Armatimonadota bacterium]
MKSALHWQKEAGARLQGSRDLDSSKLQAPAVVAVPSGGFRLYYTAVGPGRPFPQCQGYILSAFSEDGVTFVKDPGIRLAPRPEVPHMSLRLVSPDVVQCADGRWRMYVEARGPASLPTVIISAVSTDMLQWELEDGIRLQGAQRIGGPRYTQLPDGRGRLYCFRAETEAGHAQSIISAVTSDGLNFDLEPGYRMRDGQAEYDAVGVTAAEVIPPAGAGDRWTMFYSTWQDVPPGTVVPLHPSQDPNFADDADFAAATIACDICGYRSRIMVAYSDDGLAWEHAGCAIDGEGYGGEGMDAIHAEDLSLIALGDGRYRMYYASCDNAGVWRVLSAVSGVK